MHTGRSCRLTLWRWGTIVPWRCAPPWSPNADSASSPLPYFARHRVSRPFAIRSPTRHFPITTLLQLVSSFKNIYPTVRGPVLDMPRVLLLAVGGIIFTSSNPRSQERRPRPELPTRASTRDHLLTRRSNPLCFLSTLVGLALTEDITMASIPDTRSL